MRFDDREAKTQFSKLVATIEGGGTVTTCQRVAGDRGSALDQPRRTAVVGRVRSAPGNGPIMQRAGRFDGAHRDPFDRDHRRHGAGARAADRVAPSVEPKDGTADEAPREKLQRVWWGRRSRYRKRSNKFTLE